MQSEGVKAAPGTESVWTEFVPLREQVRKLQQRKKDVPEELLLKWRDMRNRIVDRYYDVVRKVARSVSTKIVEVEEETLASMGVDGLYDAVDGYDPDRKDKKTGRIIKFETFAAYRIRGSIIDSIRREDWVPRLVRARLKKIEQKRDAFVSEHGRQPTEAEMAKAMDMELQAYMEFEQSAKLKLIKSLNAACGRHDGSHGDDETSVGELVPDVSAFEPVEHIKRNELLSKLFGRGFTPLDRTIIHSYYFEGMSMADIARSVGMSESSVSVKHTQIIARLKDKISRNPEFFGDHFREIISE